MTLVFLFDSPNLSLTAINQLRDWEDWAINDNCFLQTLNERWIIEHLLFSASSSNFYVYDFSDNLIGADSLLLLGHK